MTLRDKTHQQFFIGGLVRHRSRAVKELLSIPIVVPYFINPMLREDFPSHIPGLLDNLTICCRISLELLAPYRRITT